MRKCDNDTVVVVDSNQFYQLKNFAWPVYNEKWREEREKGEREREREKERG